jgi:hypothetical protein
MLVVIAILIADSRLLGTLRESDAGSARRICLGLLAGVAVLKVFWGRRALQLVKETEERAAKDRETVYVKNARGAKWTTWLCGAASVGVLVLGAALAR